MRNAINFFLQAYAYARPAIPLAAKVNGKRRKQQRVLRRVVAGMLASGRLVICHDEIIGDTAAHALWQRLLPPRASPAFPDIPLNITADLQTRWFAR